MFLALVATALYTMSDIYFVGIKASQNTYVNQLAVHGSAKLVIEKHVDACKTYRPLYPFFFCSFKSGKFGYALAYFVWRKIRPLACLKRFILFLWTCQLQKPQLLKTRACLTPTMLGRLETSSMYMMRKLLLRLLTGHITISLSSALARVPSVNLKFI